MSESVTPLQPQSSKYVFTEIIGKEGMHGLRIQGEGRNTVFIAAIPTCFLVRYQDERGEWRTRAYGFFDYYPFAEEVVSGLLTGWEPPEGQPNLPGVYRWVRKQTGRAIGKRLNAFYKRCLAEVDPSVLNLQRSVFAATFSTPRLALREELYKEKYVVKDVTLYRAAAIALASLTWFHQMEIDKAYDDARRVILTSEEQGSLEALAERLGVEISLRVLHGEDNRQQAPLGVDDALGMMENWRGLFSPTGESYRSLDRTLMNLPGGVPATLVAYLRLVWLECPVFSRSELAVLTLYQKRRYGRAESRRNESVFAGASEERIARATRLVAEHTRNPLSTRKTEDLKFVVNFLMDYPEEHKGNIVGLAERSIRWHRHQQQLEVERHLQGLNRARPTEVPPIPLPVDPKVRFLGDAREICQEGVKMNNCVASYAGRAARGLCYLFHVSHAGEEATIEVNRAGRVVQAAGPNNTINAASRWGRRALGRWGRGFPEVHASTPPAVTEEDVYVANEINRYEDIPF